tara:strand:+ start:67596 stop:69374 length:1779 start_codon:yes stop_codon:yes gene_type:complete
MKKKIVFRVIAILLPFVLLFLIEITLRIVGYGTNYQLFHSVPIENGVDYLEMNPKIVGKYFKDNGLRSDNQSDLFLKTKTDSTFRIFVQGASTVVGFPFYRGGSFPRMLKHRLSLTFPNKNIEVVNTGITAVSSYTLWDLTDEIIAQKPDLVIIYAGHNEYYGALGVGSSISYGSHPSLIRAYLKLKKLRFFQLLENNYNKLIAPDIDQPSKRETTLMEVMAKEQRIPYNSDVYYDGLRQYENNLNRIVTNYKNHQIPVILSTVVSNEKDIKPFISDRIPDMNEFITDLKQGNLKANKLAQNNATAAYKLGRFWLEKNQDTAKKYLHLAKELDFLRFRAPETINTLIIKLSKKHNIPFVDMETVFKKKSPHMIIGDELLTEHVHPNIKGQFLMADAFYQKIKELHFLNDWSHYIPFDEAFQDIPVSEIDSIQGKLVVADLKKSWPYDINMSGKSPTYNYVENPSFEARMAQDIYKKMANWDQVMALAYKTYETDKNYDKALHIAESLIFEYPEQSKVYQMAGAMCLQMNKLDKAVYYFSKCNYFEKSILSAQQLASVYIKLNKMEFAKKTLLEAKKRGLKVKNFDQMIQEKN